jgi:hypothetical protein
VLHPERFVEYLTATYGHHRLSSVVPRDVFGRRDLSRSKMDSAADLPIVEASGTRMGGSEMATADPAARSPFCAAALLTRLDVAACWSRRQAKGRRRGPGTPDPRTGPDQPGRARQIVKPLRRIR